MPPATPPIIRSWRDRYSRSATAAALLLEVEATRVGMRGELDLDRGGVVAGRLPPAANLDQPAGGVVVGGRDVVVGGEAEPGAGRRTEADVAGGVGVDRPGQGGVRQEDPRVGDGVQPDVEAADRGRVRQVQDEGAGVDRQANLAQVRA